MSQGRYPFALAYAAACLFLANVSYCCERIQIAGSLRRLESQYGHPADVPGELLVGDVEIVAVPKLEASRNLLFERLEQVRYQLWEGVDKNGKRFVRSGQRYRKYALPSPGSQHLLPCDLFLTNARAWGYILTLRTGPAEWGRALVTPRSQGGLKRADIILEGGMVYRDTPALREPLDTPEEADFFELLGLPYVEPHKRSLEAARQLHNQLKEVA
jgi:DNA polymerase/3'-5' exonuclease PolX